MRQDPKIAILGAGLMGHGIAQLFAARGFEVAIQDPVEKALASVPERVVKICGQLGDDPACADRIGLFADLPEAVHDADLVIEAAPEKPGLKQAIFADLVANCRPEAILATNSSVIPVGVIAEGIDDANAGRILGTHFWNPPHLIPLVEVIQAKRTDRQAVAETMRLLTAAGKTPVHVRKDVVIGNRFQHAMWREALAAVDAGICSAETADTIIKNTFGLRLEVLGPLENADLVGLDLIRDVHEVVFPQLNTSDRPMPILEKKVAAGDLGMSTGKGFYSWTEEQCERVRDRLVAHLLDRRRKGG